MNSWELHLSQARSAARNVSPAVQMCLLHGEHIIWLGVKEGPESESMVERLHCDEMLRSTSERKHLGSDLLQSMGTPLAGKE